MARERRSRLAVTMTSDTEWQTESPDGQIEERESVVGNVRHARRAPPAPLVGAALSGFVVGVVLTLLLSGVMIPASSGTNRASTRLPTPSRPGERQLYAQVRHLVLSRLGPSDVNAKASRLMSLHLLPVGASAGDPYHDDSFRTVAIIFRLYDHPLGPAWRLRAARADVFSVMKALYTSGLPIYDVEMLGMFPLASGKHYQTQTVLEALMSYRAASRIPWKRLSRDQEGQLWNSLPYKYIDPRFG